MSLRSVRSVWLFLAAFSLGLLVSCTVRFDDSLPYFCRTTADCGGDGYVCAVGRLKSACCKPSGIEVCDGLDNDCDGATDNTGKSETCNGIDDDCNGAIDDGFDFRTNQNNCGSCGNVCATNEYCSASACKVRLESQCFDGLDDDGNGKSDCEDEACEGRTCGAACLCHDLQKTETVCSDGLDNETDGVTDCHDTDCLGKSCRAGCTCVADGGQTETNCTDGEDNDLDGVADCLDTDCLGQFCTPPDIYFTCAADQLCKCNGSVQVAEVGSKFCRDGVDNDCNGKLDCAEISCAGQSCAADGGLGCQCSPDAGGKREADCTNMVDDDDDSKVDCGDEVDCPSGTPCTPGGADAGIVCASQRCG